MKTSYAPLPRYRYRSQSELFYNLDRRHGPGINPVQEMPDISERRASRVLGQHRSARRKPARSRADEPLLTAEIVHLAADTAVAGLPRRRGNVGSYDFGVGHIHEGKAFRMLAVIDEHGRGSMSGARAMMCPPFSPGCSGIMPRLTMYARITARSLLPMPCATIGVKTPDSKPGGP